MICKSKGDDEMPLVIKEGNISVGAYRIVGRKLPQLCIETGDQLEFFGEFNSDDKANAFMQALAKFIGAEKAENN